MSTDRNDYEPIRKTANFRPKVAPARAKERRQEGHHRSATRAIVDQASEDPRSGSPSSSRDQPRDRDQGRLPHAERLASSDVFTVDTIGDASNLQYGSLHKYSIPSYRRSGGGVVLGLRRGEKIDARLSTDSKIFTASQDDQFASKRNKQLWSRTAPSHGHYIRPGDSAASSEERYDGFLSLEERKSHKHERTAIGFSTDKKASRDTNKGSSASDTTDSSDESAPEPIRKSPQVTSDAAEHDFLEVRSQLNKNVEKDPSSGGAWIELIEHHSYSPFFSSSSVGHLPLATELSSAAHSKVPLVEKALKVVRDPQHRQGLLRIYMREGSRIWDAVKLSRVWKDVLSKNHLHPLLWTDYLDFLQTKSNPFGIAEIREEFAMIIRKLKSTQPSETKMRIPAVYYALLRATLFLKEAGYIELAVAIWQANLELNLLYNSAAQDHAMIESFEEFWENEAPRIGEDNSKGWRTTTACQDDNQVRGTDQLHPPTFVAELSQWADAEKATSERDSMPARTLDEVDDNDPYRIVLFTDIKPFIISVDRSSDLCTLDFIAAFLEFCGLPPIPGSISARSWWLDPFIRNHSLEWSRPHGDGRQSATLQASCANVIFDTSMSFPYEADWVKFFGELPGSCLLPWIRKTLRQIMETTAIGMTLSEYILGLEFTIDAASSKKLAKSMIKAHPSNISLYNSYAAIEAGCGNHDAAERTLATVAKMTKDQVATMTVWTSRAWNLVSMGAWRKGLEILIESSGQKSHNADQRVNRTVILRVQKALSDSRDQLLATGDTGQARCYIELLMLLQYLHNEQSLEAALESFSSSLKLIPETSKTGSCREMLHQARGRLLYVHMKQTSLFSPSIVRGVLQDSISLFPFNTMFLGLFAFVERRFRIDDRVRSVIQDQLVPSTPRAALEPLNAAGNLILHYFAIDTELKRNVELGSTSHSIRNAFERAVQGEEGRANAGLWKWYCLFECESGNVQRAVDVFYRAIGACPWAKELYMLAFGGLREAMGLEQLRDVYNTMEEREIRVRVRPMFDAADQAMRKSRKD